MIEKPVEKTLAQLEDALDRLAEALSQPESNPLLIDGTVQRFEFSIELFWKTLRHLLIQEGVEVYSPKQCLQKAYQFGWIEDEQAWLDMLTARNQTSHTYNKALAEQVFQNIRTHYPEFRKVVEGLRKRLAGG